MFTNVSVFAFLSVAFSTNSSILLTVLFSYFSVTFISSNPSKTILPDNTWSAFFTSCVFVSPVRDAVSRLPVPLTTIPSNGIFSPFFAITISPTFTSDGSNTSIPSIVLKLAYSCYITFKTHNDFLVLFIAFSSSIFPISYRVITIKHSICLPTK